MKNIFKFLSVTMLILVFASSNVQAYPCCVYTPPQAMSYSLDGYGAMPYPTIAGANPGGLYTGTPGSTVKSIIDPSTGRIYVFYLFQWVCNDGGTCPSPLPNDRSATVLKMAVQRVPGNPYQWDEQIFDGLGTGGQHLNYNTPNLIGFNINAAIFNNQIHVLYTDWTYLNLYEATYSLSAHTWTYRTLDSNLGGPLGYSKIALTQWYEWFQIFYTASNGANDPTAYLKQIGMNSSLVPNYATLFTQTPADGFGHTFYGVTAVTTSDNFLHVIYSHSTNVGSGVYKGQYRTTFNNSFWSTTYTDVPNVRGEAKAVAYNENNSPRVDYFYDSYVNGTTGTVGVSDWNYSYTAYASSFGTGRATNSPFVSGGNTGLAVVNYRGATNDPNRIYVAYRSATGYLMEKYRTSSTDWSGSAPIALIDHSVPAYIIPTFNSVDGVADNGYSGSWGRYYFYPEVVSGSGGNPQLRVVKIIGND